nr:OTU domain-containing [Passiflora edulis]
MIVHELDPDVIRWGLHSLIDVFALSHSGSCNSITQCAADASEVGYVGPYYAGTVPSNNVENDAIIASALQEELSRIATAEASGVNNPEQELVVAQNWHGRHHHSGSGGKSLDAEEPTLLLDLLDEEALDGEVGKRFNQMVPVPHVPKVNGELLPSEDEQISDHQRLLDRLKLYDLVEKKVQGDGNCQFRSLSDQLYSSPDHHKFVRQRVIDQLKAQPHLYEGYVPRTYCDYLKKMSKSGEWGDHVTLQAAADSYGLRIFVMTSFKDTCYIEILPLVQKSERVIYLSFWAEVHYNSIYPEGELALYETKKQKKWWEL